MADALYTLRSKDAHTHNVAKMDEEFEPLEIYTIIENERTGELTCTCPSRFQPCKHVKLLKHAMNANPDDYKELYWKVAPHAKWISAVTAEALGLNQED